jgi:hypothetical protein
MKTFDHLDAIHGAALVEYHDPDPCTPRCPVRRAAGAGRRQRARQPKRYKGVTIEANLRRRRI